MKRGIIDRTLACDLWDGVVYQAWKQLEPVVMIRRRRARGLCANFEYLAVLCEKSLAKTQGDYYPRGAPRMMIDQRSLEAAAAIAQDEAEAAQRRGAEGLT